MKQHDRYFEYGMILRSDRWESLDAIKLNEYCDVFCPNEIFPGRIQAEYRSLRVLDGLV